MRHILLAGIAALLAACGVETASTAATAAAAKKQEVEQGRKTMEQAGARAAGAMDQGQERLRDADK
jgi:outer membrane biogenesis lipoprotein LolB